MSIEVEYLLDKEEFLKNYRIKRAFEDSQLEWEVLSDIYDDYMTLHEEINECHRQLTQYITSKLNIPIHSIHGRGKSPEHLIEKIIRKRGIEQSHKYIDINKENYREIVRDLIGVRILTLSKEEWEQVHDWLCNKFPPKGTGDIYMAEEPQAYTRYGDRDIFKNKIHKEHTNKGYRSQHYVVWFNGYYCEIQVRTLSEEVYGEFDHKVKYPYRNQNKFLVRYTNVMSQFLDSVDEMISTCFQMQEDGWEYNNQYYEDDDYVDWKHVSQNNNSQREEEVCVPANEDDKVEMDSYANQFFLRKGR